MSLLLFFASILLKVDAGNPMHEQATVEIFLTFRCVRKLLVELYIIKTVIYTVLFLKFLVVLKVNCASFFHFLMFRKF